MLNRFWLTLMLASVACAFCMQNTNETWLGLLASGGKAVELLMTIMASVTMWSGLMEILNDAGDVSRIGRFLRRIAAPLFGGVKDEACWEAIGMNLSANLLGIGNAATPAGIRAAQLLAEQGQAGMKALGMLLVLNNAGLQAMPATVIALRQAAGSTDAAGIWLPSAASSVVGCIVSVSVMMILARRSGKEQIE